MKIKENLISIFCLIISTILFTCVYSYFVYVVDIETDVNVWKYIVTMMGKGKLIYRDLFDHKGPMLYFFYWIFKDFRVVSQAIILAIDEIFIYKTTKLIVKSKYNIKNILITAICMVLYIITFSDAPNTENYSIPFIVISMYYFVKNILVELDIKSFFIIGLCASVVLMLRINILVLWVVIYAYFIAKLISKKNGKDIVGIIKYSSLGAMVCLVPVFIYLLCNGIIKDFVECYILFNLRYASVSGSNLTIVEVIKYFSKCTLHIYPILFIINVVLIFVKGVEKGKRELLIANLIFLIITTYIVISPRRLYLHYIAILMPSAIIILSVLVDRAKNLYISCFTVGIYGLAFFYLAVFGFKVEQHRIIAYKSNTKVVSYFVEKVDNYTNIDDNILIIGNYVSIYNFSNRHYEGKYFYQDPIMYCGDDMASRITGEIKEQAPDYIVIINYNPDENRLADRQITEILNKNYEKLDKFMYKRIK